eukprot:CAMPEP_0194265108 /NCGR_PEP_ID=MMETSP0169-20130528/446_1 /TAXON_ID=218684 /ORGANISM="Corethron pennatum, Strain L29A3" /LENGTH=626 /DNA_ID=CAMNT_0039005509 /DNA_START=30 /DNA_END=1910 /DNA_ORIENTATION=+
MTNAGAASAALRGSVPTDKIYLHLSGFKSCGFFQRAVNVMSSISTLFPSRLQVTEHSFGTRDEYRNWLLEGPNAFRSSSSDPLAKKHTSSPFVWIGDRGGGKPGEVGIKTFVGGHDDSLSWARALMEPKPASTGLTASMVPDGYTAGEYDYDLLVVGGGSGGLAASKEAVKHGARVAVLDFVKPSPAGSVWGLGGTCVNVGCIPKKLYHRAAISRESYVADAEAFGLGAVAPPPANWETLRTNIQNYIRGLNFKYRVSLREADVTYKNALGKFVDPHTMTLTDKKGRESTVTFGRCLVATGGRPTPLSCPGGELAVSSDDIFSMKSSPGKTLCVGASYISLECAGFLAGLGLDVTVAVRSILLRGFDRECAEKIGEFMEDAGVTFRRGVVPVKLEKTAEGKIAVTFDDEKTENFDTVLVAIGRSGDTKSLGLENVGIKTVERNEKIAAKFEQTIVPNIYCIGDVMEGCPELTPVAIEAGLALSKRLFSSSTKPMDYENVCTTVFTPVEFGTVGLSEEDAKERYGADNIDVYHKEFTPLEWGLSPHRQNRQCFTKVIVEKATDKVVGIHFLGPEAGEVMQGYGVAMKKGMTFTELSETVGIHPTSSEEIVTLSVTKASGKDASAGGC